MGKRGTLTVRVVSDTKDGEKGLDRFATKAQTTGQKVEDAGRKMTVFATVPVAAAMGYAANAASNLNETLSKSNTVFGDAADEVEEWADTASDSFGQSKREALDAASSFGNLFVQLGVGADRASKMSIEMTELASDFASFHNADITEVIEAQTAAFRGEYDSLQKFVPTINAATVEQQALAMTGKTVTSELTAQEKALAVQTLMLKGAGDAMGDFDRTSGSAANQMRTAKAAMEDASAELGAALLPLVAKTSGAVADLAGVFGDLPEPVQNGVLALAGVLAVSGPLMAAGGKIVGAWSKAGSAMETTAIAALYAKDNLAKLAKGGAALAAAGVAIKLYGDMMSDAKDEGEEFAQSVRDSFDPSQAGYAETQAALEGVRGKIGELDDSVDDSFLGRNTINKDFNESMQTAADDLRGFEGEMEVAIARADDLASKLGITKEEAYKLATSEEVLAEALDPATGKLDAQKVKAKEAADAHQALEDRIKGVSDALRASIDPLFATREALDNHKGAQDDLKVANLEYLAATADVDKAVEEHGRKSDEAAAAWVRQVDAKRRVEEADRAVVESAIAVSEQTADLTAKMEAGEVKIADAEAQLRAWVDQGLITADQAYKTSQELRGVASAADEIDGRDVAMSVRLANVAEVIAQLDELSRRTGTPLLSNAGVAARDQATPGAAQIINNVTVNNPAPEPTSESLPRILRKVEYGGLMGPLT